MPSVNSGELSNLLLAISQTLADRTQLASTMDAILAAARQLTQARHGIMYVLDQTGQALVPLSVHKHEQPLQEHPWVPLQLELLKENDPFGYAITTGEIVLINDLYAYSGYNCDAIYQNETAMDLHSANLLAWPLKDHQNLTVGLLVLFDLCLIEDEQSLSVFTKLAGTSIRQAMLLDTYHTSLRSLEADNAALNRENKQLKARKKADYNGPIAESDPMRQVLERLQRILALPVDVLLRGETGAGKEVIARYIHENSDRAGKPFIAQNCAAIPEQLLESELFGHKRGAFTGADKDKKGLFEAADGGTLFLDEIGDMPLLLQAKLLRVLQERKIRPIGSSEERSIDVRVVAATHCNLKEKIQKNEFRADLFYRLNVFPITLPPLRERPADILPLAEHFITLTSQKLGLDSEPVISKKARQSLMDYPFPGNVRELRNIIERAVLLSDFETVDAIELGEGDTFIPDVQADIPDDSVFDSTLPEVDMASLKDSVTQYERTVIMKTLERFNWQTRKAAESLAVPLSTLSHKIKKYEIMP
ncbi:sigma 54-interacting transcriptional regulator [Photobacterium sp. R1]